MSRIALIRHGQASFGAADYDVLSELGHRQSVALGRALRRQGLAPDAAFTGAQRRHRETWEGLAEGLSSRLVPQVHEGLNEFDFAGLLAARFPHGLPEGADHDRRTHFRTLRDTVLLWQKDEVPDPPETWADFTARVAAARDALAAAGEHVLAVSSGGAIAQMVAMTLETPSDRMIELQLQMKNCAVTQLIAARRGIYLHGFNETPHVARRGRGASDLLMTHAAAQLDLTAVEGWLTRHLPGFRGPLSAEKFAGGQSNPTFRLEAASGSYVLRRKPPGTLLKSAHAVDREYRVQKALAGTDVPVARMHVLCEDEGVIGSAFYVMEHVAGRNFLDPRLPDLDAPERTAIYDEMNRVLAAIHSVDVAAAGLEDYGPPGDYYRRQIGRWTKQYRASETEPVPAMDELIAWLDAHLPPDDGRRTLVHGDYRIDNMLFAPDRPDCVAVLDWELSTLGHPFADLAALLMQWRMPPGPEGRGLAGVDRAALGIPADAAFVDRYCERTRDRRHPSAQLLRGVRLLPHGGDPAGGEEAGARRQRLEPRAGVEDGHLCAALRPGRAGGRAWLRGAMPARSC